MNINRHNYEEYFILYLDDELAPNERRAVEDFVDLHPDLKDELDLLMQFRLTPDTSLVFQGKEDLLKGEDHIHAGNYHDLLLLYIDNELSSDKQSMVEEFVKENVIARDELHLLLKTKLSPESIVFNDKASLYRREERKIPFIWLRIAAAIIIAALGTTIFFAITRKKPVSDPSFAYTNDREQINNGAKPVITGKNENVSQRKEADPTFDNKEAAGTGQPRENKILPSLNHNSIATNDIKKPKDELVQPTLKKEEPLAIVEIKKDNNLPKPGNDALSKIEEKAIASNKTGNDLKEITSPNKSTDVTSRTDQPSDIRTAVYDPNNDGFADNGKDHKNKLRGFFRKVSRTFEKRTKIDATDDDKLLVAGFSIKLK